MRRLRKKGSVRDIILLVVILFMLAFGFIIFHKVSNDVIDNMQDVTIISSSETANATLDTAKTITNSLDWLILVVYIGFLIGLVITSFLIETHPIFFVLYIIILLVSIALAAIMANVWYLSTSTSTLAATVTTDFTITDFFMGKLPLFTAIGGMLGLIIMYGKSRREQ